MRRIEVRHVECGGLEEDQRKYRNQWIKYIDDGSRSPPRHRFLSIRTRIFDWRGGVSLLVELIVILFWSVLVESLFSLSMTVKRDIAERGRDVHGVLQV